MKIKLRTWIFYSVFVLVFCLSSILLTITWLNDWPIWRLGYAALVVLPLILLYGIRMNNVTVAYVMLTIVIILSGFYNNSSISNIVLFLRTLVFSYLIYRLVDIYVRSSNIVRILKLCVLVAMIQLPVVLLQKLFYSSLPKLIRLKVSSVDFTFGTFHYYSDAGMNFFVILIVVFFLFGKQRNAIFPRYKLLIMFWLTLTVFVSQSEFSKIIIILVWMGYLITHLNIKIATSTLVLLLALVLVLNVFGYWEPVQKNLRTAITVNITNAGKYDYSTGQFSRGAAFLYYINSEIKWLGDGPGAYYDPITHTTKRQNSGHLLSFYSEVGLFGWLLSVVIFAMIAFPKHGKRMIFNKVNLLSFIIIQMLSAVTPVMNDIHFMLIYCIIVRAYLIQPKNNNLLAEISSKAKENKLNTDLSPKYDL